MKDHSAANLNAPQPCGLRRRIGCMSYDLLLLAAVLMLSSMPAVFIHGGAIYPGHSGFQLYLAAIAAGYFLFFWSRGQTPGMRAWRVRLALLNGAALPPGERWRRPAIRYLAAAALDLLPLGAGLWWSLGSARRLTFADRLSGTCLIVELRKL